VLLVVDARNQLPATPVMIQPPFPTVPSDDHNAVAIILDQENSLQISPTYGTHGHDSNDCDRCSKSQLAAFEWNVTDPNYETYYDENNELLDTSYSFGSQYSFLPPFRESDVGLGLQLVEFGDIFDTESVKDIAQDEKCRTPQMVASLVNRISSQIR